VSDVSSFVAACISSPALLTSACGALVVPVLAWFVARALAHPLARMSDDPGWQAMLAATAAALPGSLFLVIGTTALVGGWHSACLQFASARVLYGVVAAMTAVGFARAVVLTVRRVKDMQHLARQSFAPSARIRAAGEAAGIRTRELRVDGAVMLLAGFLRPVVLVSPDAVERINDAELFAAVRHEAAHSVRGDLICAAVVSFVADLVPLPVENLVALYWRAREFAADAHATRNADPCDLASALLALARPAGSVRAVAAIADAGTVRDRLNVLLTPLSKRPSRVRRSLLTAAFSMTFVLGAAPALVAAVLGFTCSMTMPS
jgi:Zn-dependent protease with chaperone function